MEYTLTEDGMVIHEPYSDVATHLELVSAQLLYKNTCGV